MHKWIFKTIFFILVLCGALFFFETKMNQGNTDMTSEMAQATMPLVTMQVSGQSVNQLHGYSMEMDPAYMRDTITPLEGNRNLSIFVQKFDETIKSMSYEVRSGDGNRLIEDTQITDYKETTETVMGNLSIKDLIEAGQEYNLIVKLETASGKLLRYYTRIIYVEEYHVREKVDFIKAFHENTFHRASAPDTIGKYLESDRTGDNSTFQKVNIHSSLKQVTWGDLQIAGHTDPVIDIKEMMQQTASFQVSFRVTYWEGKNQHTLNVKEYYRIRYTADRTYLLNYEREAYQIFDETADVYHGDKISLGVQDKTLVSLVESDGGELFSFGVGGKIYSYNVADKKLAKLLAFADGENPDDRTAYDNFGTKILTVEETGNIQFLVYGYMNRGMHEGENGVQVNLYDNSTNTVQELLFIPYRKSPRMLRADLNRLCYATKNGRLYILVDGAIYEISLEKKSYQILTENLAQDNFCVSENGDMAVWCLDGDYEDAKTLRFLNMKSGRSVDIEAGPAKRIRPLGFMEDDLVYGLADAKDITRDLSGRIFYPMHTICIQDFGGNILKEYQVENTYVVDWEMDRNQILLTRMERDPEKETYTEASSDQIMNSTKETIGKNVVESIVVDTLETVTQIAVKNDVETDSRQLLSPREVLFEGENEMALSEDVQSPSNFFLYSMKGFEGGYVSEAKAVEKAYEESGVVLGKEGNLIWYKGNRVTKNQIMKITGQQADEERSQLATCLDTILEFEGVNRSTQYMLDQGITTGKILEENIPGVQALDLTGCKLDAILYYVNQDIPVLVTLDDTRSMLVIGFNELNVVVMNPENGQVYKIGMNDSTALFEESGNQFQTYIRLQR